MGELDGGRATARPPGSGARGVHRRVQVATLSAVTVAVLLLGVPLALAGVVLQGAQARSSAATRADAVLSAVDARTRSGQRVGADALGRASGGGRWPERVRVVLPTGRALVVGPSTRGWGGVGASASARGADGTLVVVQVPRRSLLAADARLVAIVLFLAAGAVAAGWAVGLVQARRLAAPLVALAERAEQLGSGRVPAAAGHSGIAEVDQVARALSRSAQELADRLAAEREFASEASHQLRTPLTALSLRLEEIEGVADDEAVKAEARTALGQVERLTGVVEDLLARARSRPQQPARVLVLAQVLTQQQQEWAPAFAHAGRHLDVAAPPAALRVRASPGPLAQALATLVENSLVHGRGTTRVVAREGGEGVVVEVSDDGPGIPAALAAHVFERRVSGAARTGLGLALARDLVAAGGGRLELVRAAPAVFALFLPTPQVSQTPQALSPQRGS